MSKNSVLIATNPDDMHAASVLLAIRELGRKADIWLPGDIPESSCASINLSDGLQESVHVQHLDGCDPVSNYETFWFRRLARPQILGEGVHPADRDMALNESRAHIEALLHCVSRSTTCVNGFAEATYAEVKPNQLRAATQVGLKIPRTLISNDPVAIRDFIGSPSNICGVIYKPYRTPVWHAGGDLALGYTSLVTQSDLPSDSTLRLTPGIFQEHVRKEYELRIIWLGGKIIAVKIYSQEIPDARIDWRVAQDARMRLECVNLPDEVEVRCAALMRSLSLRFGCIDMIVSESGEHIFLEVNQMGQFLWIEDINPEIELFDAFVQFIMNPLSFYKNYKKVGLSYHEYRHEAESYLLGIQSSRHCHLQSEFVYNESQQ